MRIWWGFRFGMEFFLFFGASFYFLGGGGYLYNYRKRYVWHKQKRERSLFRNPYFTPVVDRKLQYDRNFNVIKKDGKHFIESRI